VIPPYHEDSGPYQRNQKTSFERWLDLLYVCWCNVSLDMFGGMTFNVAEQSIQTFTQGRIHADESESGENRGRLADIGFSRVLLNSAAAYSSIAG
jgi:hypothetical protein